MQRNRMIWGGLAVAMLAMMMPRLWPKARLAARRAVAMPYVTSGGSGRATADPARGYPA